LSFNFIYLLISCIFFKKYQINKFLFLQIKHNNFLNSIVKVIFKTKYINTFGKKSIINNIENRDLGFNE